MIRTVWMIITLFLVDGCVMTDASKCRCNAVGVEIPSGVVLNEYDNPRNLG
jgi:hypothetical protein